MNRRGVLVGAAALLAGCGGNGGNDGPPQFDGPDTENATALDLGWRQWEESEVRERKSTAIEVEYDELRLNTDQYVGETVHFADAEVTQVLDRGADDTFLVGLVLDRTGPQILFGSWVGGDPGVVRGTGVEVWGYVLGVERYRAPSGVDRTVPAVSIVDMRVVESAATTTNATTDA